jgi:hypothetical protein
MFLFRKDHAEVPVPRPRIWLFASSVLQQPKERNTLKNLLLTRVIKMTWKWEFELHPKILLQYLRIKVISLSTVQNGARGGVVVKALRYKPAGRGFDSRWCHWNFSVT